MITKEKIFFLASILCGIISVYFSLALTFIYLSPFDSSFSEVETQSIYPRIGSFLYILFHYFHLHLLVFLLIIGILWSYLANTLHKKNFIISVFSVSVSLVFLELILRFAGFSPGRIEYSRWFREVDKLEEYKGFSSNKEGIFRIDTTLFNGKGVIQSDISEIMIVYEDFRTPISCNFNNFLSICRSSLTTRTN